jgi:hypothetical protein
MPTKMRDLTGQRFGKLIAIEVAGKNNNGDKFMWKCKCDCGNEEFIALGTNLTQGRTTSCGCSRRGNTNVRFEFGEAAFNNLWYNYHMNAKNRGIDFLLSREEFRFLTQEKCFYCGIGPEQKAGTETSNGYYIYNGIDRVDNKIGYISENVVSCCKKCNFRKSDMTTEEFLSWVKLVYKHSVLPILQI